MIWIFVIIAQFWFGFEIMNPFLLDKLDSFLKLIISLPFGMMTSSLISFIFSSIFGNNIFHLLLHTIGLFTISGYLYTLRKRKKKSIKIEKPKGFQIVCLVISILVSFLLTDHFYLKEERSLSNVCI